VEEDGLVTESTTTDQVETTPNTGLRSSDGVVSTIPPLSALLNSNTPLDQGLLASEKVTRTTPVRLLDAVLDETRTPSTCDKASCLTSAMASPRPHTRTQSTFSTTSSTSYTPSRLNPHRTPQSTSLRDIAYNGSEGLINDLDAPAAACFDGNVYDEDPVTTPSRIVTPPARPAFGARFLSSLSNAQPAAAALGRKGSILHSRAKSLAAYVPKLNTGTTTTTSSDRLQTQAPNRIFGDLFNGESAPIRLGPPLSPSKEKEETEFVMEYTPTLTERPGSMFKRRDTTESMRSTPPAQTRKASWFARKPTSTTPTRLQQQDELASLNISQALFPNGAADPLSPAAFNDLLLNATDLLSRMQSAYKEKTDFIASMQPELSAQREEVEEAETRSQHLKFQLEDMGQRAQQQEEAMQEMAAQLAEEKMRVQELRENAARSVRLVRRDSNAGDEEQTPTRHSKRRSHGSSYASDSGFESDLDSVFSAASGAETPISPASASVVGLVGPAGLVGLDGENAQVWNLRQGGRPGKGEGAAWATVEVLRSENQGLKVRMGEMERGMQGCIDFVGALNGV